VAGLEKPAAFYFVAPTRFPAEASPVGKKKKRWGKELQKKGTEKL